MGSFFRKRNDPFETIARIKLWPSRKGVLHGVRSVTRHGNRMKVVTHCNQKSQSSCSKNGRIARWIRNKWFVQACPACRVPEWKLEKYDRTAFVKGKQKHYDRRSDVFAHTETTPH